MGKKVCNAPRATDFREERNPPQADSIVSNNKLCTIQYCNITIPYCDIPYCRIRRDAPPITATPSLLPKRRRRIPTIVPSYRPVLRRHQFIVESSGPLVVILFSQMPAIHPVHIPSSNLLQSCHWQKKVGGPVGPFPPFFLNLAGLEKKNQVPKT